MGKVLYRTRTLVVSGIVSDRRRSIQVTEDLGDKELFLALRLIGLNGFGFLRDLL